MATGRLRGLGKERHFYENWPNFNKDEWPGRELLWLWCHPAMAVVIVITGIWEIFLVLDRIFD